MPFDDWDDEAEDAAPLPAEPAWPEVEGWLREASNAVEVLPALPHAGVEALNALHVDERSTLGAIAGFTGGLIVDSGWLRVLGSGHARLPGSILDWNGLGQRRRVATVAGALIVAHDLIGGLFAVNAGGLPCEPGELHHFSLERRRWEPMSMGYTGFIRWVCDGDLAGFSNDLRWPDWEDDAEGLGGDQGLHLWPPPWAVAAPKLVDSARRILPMDELVQAIFTGRPPPPGSDD